MDRGIGRPGDTQERHLFRVQTTTQSQLLDGECLPVCRMKYNEDDLGGEERSIGVINQMQVEGINK